MNELEKDMQLLLNLRRLKEIKRCNNFYTIKQEDVAQHSYFVSLLSYYIAEDHNRYSNDKLNIEQVLKKSLLHDTEEAFISDIPWTVKHSIPNFSESKNEIINDIYKGSGDIHKKFNAIQDKCKDGKEGELVAMVDLLELAIYCSEEEELGNKHLVGIKNKCIELINDLSREWKIEIDGKSLLVSPMFDHLFDRVKNREHKYYPLELSPKPARSVDD